MTTTMPTGPSSPTTAALSAQPDRHTQPLPSADHPPPASPGTPAAKAAHAPDPHDAQDGPDEPVRIDPVFSGSWWRNAVLWRTLTLGGALVALLGVGTGSSLYEMMNSHINDLTKQLTKVRHVAQVAVLSGAQGEAAVLVTLGNGPTPLKVQRVSPYAEPADRSLRLWAMPAGSEPRLLGVLVPGQAVQRLEADAATFKGVTALAITLEPLAAAPTAADNAKAADSNSTAPTGPVLFKGPLIPNL